MLSFRTYMLNYCFNKFPADLLFAQLYFFSAAIKACNAGLLLYLLYIIPLCEALLSSDESQIKLFKLVI